MLYLDYGKQPGTWTPNMYGGNENLDAIEFLKTMNKYIAKRGDGCFTIAEESSGWFELLRQIMMTLLCLLISRITAGLRIFLNSWELTAVQKGEYDKLTYGMLYNYGEDFMLSLNHDDFRRKHLWIWCQAVMRRHICQISRLHLDSCMHIREARCLQQTDGT
ncbi:MAG: hypothetical protein ACLS9K_03105 [Lachnospira eligens]